VITFDPDPFFEGQAGFNYVVSDGTLTDVGHVSIDIEPEFQWHNLRNPLDVDGDATVSPLDAVLIINLLNAHGSTSLENLLGGGISAPTAFYDVSPDNYVAPIDAVLVINYLNANPVGSTSVGASSVASGDSNGVARAEVRTDTTPPANVATGSVRRRAAAALRQQILPPAAVDAALRSSDIAALLADLQFGRGLRRWPLNLDF